uniref:24dehydrocholesterol reductase [Sorex araneus] n=1 Tax=Lepeophtheirus salmonis TaxID=72036 RepID=A0A0K2UHG5_LEPSM
MGGGIDTTSNRFRLFQYICTMYELVLLDNLTTQFVLF